MASIYMNAVLTLPVTRPPQQWRRVLLRVEGHSIHMATNALMGHNQHQPPLTIGHPALNEPHREEHGELARLFTLRPGHDITCPVALCQLLGARAGRTSVVFPGYPVLTRLWCF